MSRRVMNRALDFRIPQRIPHVSRLRRVLVEEWERNWWRRVGGRNTVRRALPFSRYAEGLKVNSSSSGVSAREGESERSMYFPGIGGPEDWGGTANFPGIGGGRGCSNGEGVGGLGGLGGRAGGRRDGSEDRGMRSFGGRAGAPGFE